MKLVLERSELKAAVVAWLASKGYPASQDMTLDSDGNITVNIGTPDQYVTPVIPSPTTPVVLTADPGPGYSLHCIATCFGYKDPEDDGLGAWGADNNNTTTRGVSVPIPILEATFGSLHAADIKGKTVSVILGAKLATKIDITDDGPGKAVGDQHGLISEKDGTLHALDMTAALCAELGVKYDPINASYPVIWWFEDENGKPIPMKGTDAPKAFV